MTNRLLDDERPIDAIISDYVTFRVGEGGITRIEVYPEPGEMGCVNYAAVYKGDFLWQRVDLKGWRVIYQDGGGK